MSSIMMKNPQMKDQIYNEQDRIIKLNRKL
jgi:hypothetical protein